MRNLDQNNLYIRPKIIDGATLSSEKYQGSEKYIFQIPSKNVLIELNEASYITLSHFKGKHSLLEISNILYEQFDADYSNILDDLVYVYNKMASMGFVEE